MCRKKFTEIKINKRRKKVKTPAAVQNMSWEVPVMQLLTWNLMYRRVFERRLRNGHNVERYLYRLLHMMVQRPTCPFDENTIQWVNNLEGSANNPIVVT